MPTFVEVTPETFCLYCTPAINLFEHPAEPILLDGAELNQIVRPRTRRPQAYSIFSVDRVSARQRDPESIQPERHFEPYQSLVHRVETASEQEAASGHVPRRGKNPAAARRQHAERQRQ